MGEIVLVLYANQSRFDETRRARWSRVIRSGFVIFVRHFNGQISKYYNSASTIDLSTRLWGKNKEFVNTRAKRLRMRKVSIFKSAVANANFTTRMPVFELNRTLLASKTSKQETLNLQVCTGARISRKFAAIVQESRSFRQIRASPFSVFMFDFRMKRKRSWTFKHDFRLWCKEESMWCKREKLKRLINFVFVKF